ncbi:MAG: hypothetical protein II908_10980, partial [Bacteroidaceae bacterium]|nr:hypothetical protein [Bacteroidaceae bacterium]
EEIDTLRNLTVTTETLKRFYTKTFIINHLQYFAKTSNTKIRYKNVLKSVLTGIKRQAKSLCYDTFPVLGANMCNAEF